MPTTPKKKALELVIKFCSIITGIPVDYIEKNMVIRNSISLVKNDSHFKTSVEMSLFHKIGAGNPTIPKGGWEECDCHALNCLTKLVIIFLI